MDLDGIMLNEIGQTEKDKYHIISLICGLFYIYMSPRSQIQRTDW